MLDKLSLALNTIYPLIDIYKIKDITYSIEVLTEEQKEFYFNSIMYRK